MSKHIDFTDASCKYTLVTGLNYYSQNFEYKDSKHFALEWIKKNIPDQYERLKDAKDYQFSNRGFICKMLNNGLILSEVQKDNLKKFLISIDTSSSKNDIDDYEEVTKPKSKQQKTNRIIYQMENVIDDILSDKEPQEVEIPIDKSQLNESLEWLEKQIIEAQEQIMKQQEILDNLTAVYEKCGGIKEKIEVKREPKKSAATAKKDALKATAKIAQNVKYQKEDTELQLTSISPIQVVGAKEVILYHTQYRRITHLVSQRGSKLSIKGMTIQNIDVEKSISKRISKPKAFFGIKNNYVDRIHQIPTSNQKVSGRINEDIIIVEVIK